MEKTDRLGLFMILEHILSGFKEKKLGHCNISLSREIDNFVDKKYQEIVKI